MKPLHLLLKEYQWVHLSLGLVGNVSFVVGSVLYLFTDLQTQGTWLFIIGSSGMLIGALGSALVKFTRAERNETGSGSRHWAGSSPSGFSLLCVVIGILGCLGLVIANVAGIIVVERHDPISETISALAAGEHAWIQDLGLDLFALALIACAFGLLNRNLTGSAGRIAIVLLVLLGLDVIVIAEHNQYAGQDNRGAVIHTYCVYLFGLLFALTTLLLSRALWRLFRDWSRFSLSVGLIWIAAAPLFFVVPTRWDGAYERFLGLMVIAWTISVCWLLLARGGHRHFPAA